MSFGNPYAIKNFCDAKTLIACYEDDETTQDVAADLLNGKFSAKGKLPVSVCEILNSEVELLMPADCCQQFRLLLLVSNTQITGDRFHL